MSGPRFWQGMIFAPIFTAKSEESNANRVQCFKIINSDQGDNRVLMIVVRGCGVRGCKSEPRSAMTQHSRSIDTIPPSSTIFMRFLTGYIALSFEKRQCRAVLLNWIESSGTRKTKERGSKDRIEGKTKSSHSWHIFMTPTTFDLCRDWNHQTPPIRKKVPKEKIRSKEKKQQWIIPSKHQLMTLG